MPYLPPVLPPLASAGSFRPAKERSHSLLDPRAPHSSPQCRDTSGAMSGKESKIPRQVSITSANRRRTNRFILGCFARRRPYSFSGLLVA